MQKKTIKKIIESKMNNWLSSITDDKLRTKVKSNLLVSGGSIASLFLNEEVNDYDVYIKDMDVLHELCKYYCMMHGVEVLDGRKKEILIQSEFGWVEEDDEEYSSQRYVALRTLHSDQIKLYVGAGYKVTLKEGEEPIPYRPIFFSPNAISLSDDIQIVCRFHGDAEAIHKTFDFVHATNYFTFDEGLVTNLMAMESLITKQLYYQGSLYPLTSIIRTKKFINRKWNINAGEYLKIMFQISELDLKNPDVLEEQLIGVDVAYFSTLIDILRGSAKNKEKFSNYNYLKNVIERVFNESDSDM